MDPASPSRLVPGAWPVSPSPSRRRCNSIGGPRLRQHIPGLSPHKFTPRRITRSYFDSKSTPVTPTADNTPSSFISDLSLQSSPANTSISSAYMSPFLEISPSKFKQGESLQYQDNVSRRQSSSPERGIGTYCESPSPPGDQTYFSLPEIPDLSLVSSLQEDSHITRDNFNVSDNEPSCLSFDENILETQTSSPGCRSFDTASSSSIRFRPTEVPRPEWDTQALQLLQPNDRNSWRLFLSPVSAPLGECSSLALQLSQAPLGVWMSESGCQSAGPARTNPRRSWMIGNNLPGPIHGLTEEEASTRRYANEVLDHAFRMDVDGSMFTLGIPGVDISRDFAPLKVVSKPQRRVKFSSIAKGLVHRIFNKPQIEGSMPENETDQDQEPPTRHSRHCRHSLEKEELRLQARDSVLLRGGAPGPSRQDTQGHPELQAREFQLSGIKVRARPAVSSLPGTRFRHRTSPSSKYPPALPSEKSTSENQHSLNCDIFKLEKPKVDHRQSFLRRIGI